MRVAVAVIFDKKNRVLLTQRALESSHGGLWEFPGGKLKDKEEPITALKREIKEEVDLEIIESEFLCELTYHYAEQITLHVFCVNKFEGIPKCCEKQLNLRWVELAHLNYYDFPKANDHIIEMLKRRSSVAITE